MQPISDPASWLDGLSVEVRAAVERRMRVRHMVHDEAVYSTGDAGDECYVIRSGRVRITDYSSSGKEFRVVDLRAGASFGETSLIDGSDRPDNAYAVGETELDVLDKEDFDSLYARHHEIALKLNIHLCRHIRLLASRVRDASVLTLRDRLPRLLVRLASSHGRQERPGAIVIERVSQSDLANMLGMTRQSVSRELKDLERAGLVEIRYRGLVLADVAALVERCDTLEGVV